MIYKTDLKMKHSDIGTQTLSKENVIIDYTKETQTDFNLVDYKYDLMFGNQKVIDEILLEHTFKYELDMLDHTKLIYINEEQDAKIHKELKHSQSSYRNEVPKLDFSRIQGKKNTWTTEIQGIEGENNELTRIKLNSKKVISNQILDILGKQLQNNLISPTNKGLVAQQSFGTAAKNDQNLKIMNKSSIKEGYNSFPKIPDDYSDNLSTPRMKFQKIGLKLIDSIVNNYDKTYNKEAFIRIIRLYKIEYEKNQVYEQFILDLHYKVTNLQNTNSKLTEEIKLLVENLNKSELKKADSEIKEAIPDEIGCVHCGRKNANSQFQDLTFGLLQEIQAFAPQRKLMQSKTFMFSDEQPPKVFNKGKGLSVPTISNAERKIFQKKDNINIGMVIMKKLKSLKVSNFKNYMSLKEVLKLITQIYEERMIQSRESSNAKEEEFSNFSLRMFQSNMKGSQQVALENFVIFLLSLKKYLHIVRVNLFTKFLGLNDTFKYNLDELNRYIDILEFINHSTLGATIFNAETDTRHYVPFLRVLDYVKFFAENKLAYEDYTQFKKELEIIKESDQKNINKHGIMDIDLFVLKVLTKYQEMCNNTKQYVINAFQAADLDSNHTCSLQEFNLLYKYIESEKYDEEFVKEIFEDNADIVDEGGKALSFDRFTMICLEYNLFSDAQQDLFLNLRGNVEIEEEFKRLKKEWENYSKDTKEKLNTLDKADREYWSEIYEILDEKIDNETNYKPFLIAISLLNKEIMNFKKKEVLKRYMY